MQDLLAFCLSAVPFSFCSLPPFPLFFLYYSFIFLSLCRFSLFLVSTAPFSLSFPLFSLSLSGPSFTHTYSTLQHVSRQPRTHVLTRTHTCFFWHPAHECVRQAGLEELEILWCSLGLCMFLLILGFSHISQAFMAIVRKY